MAGTTTGLFFSSRRRHTRYWRDWSSDVCSSDLAAEAVDEEQPEGARRLLGREAGVEQDPHPVLGHCERGRANDRLRSAERRVGKECRSRWSPYNYQKKTDTAPQAGQHTIHLARR